MAQLIHNIKIITQLIACIAVGSGCACETFCGEAASENSTRLLPILLMTCTAFCTCVRDRSSCWNLLLPATHSTQLIKSTSLKKFPLLVWREKKIITLGQLIFEEIWYSNIMVSERRNECKLKIEQILWTQHRALYVISGTIWVQNGVYSLHHSCTVLQDMSPSN